MRRGNHFYSLYRNYQSWRRSYEDSTSPRGKDSIFRDGQSEFGPELFIPLCFRAVETIIPKMLSAPPGMQVKPRTRDSERNVQNMKFTIDAQQEQIDYELKLQTVAKDGLIYGIGWQKCYWLTDYKLRKRLARQPSRGGGGLIEQEILVPVFDDPMAESVDPFDVIPAPFCSSVDTAEFIFHRTWRTNSYVSKMAKSGQWRNLEDVAELDGLADATKYDEVWQERDKANSDARSATGQTARSSRMPVHEVLEFHDGDQIITVLDRKIVVRTESNPHWHGQMPFQAFRPTESTHQLYGIGEIEPIEQLQEEMNTLRTQRRYNADLVLQRVFAFHDGLVDADDIKFGPGYGIPVNGDPRELLFPIPVDDIPHSSYLEEDRIGADIDGTTGISDQLAGNSDPNETATGSQLAFQASSTRIRNKLRRLELEVIVPGCRQWGALNQQKILGTRDVRVPSPPMPGQPERRWAWYQVGPDELMGEFEFTCESLSTEPDNVPQDRDDAAMLWEIGGQNPLVDQRNLISLVLEKSGIKDPEALLAPPQPQVPPEVLDVLVEEFDVPREMVAQALAMAGGPDLLAGAPQGAGPNPEQQPAPSQNGSGAQTAPTTGG